MSNRASRNIYYAAVLVALLGVGLALIARYPLRVNDDVAFNLEIGHFIRDGARPYIDYVDINFPTIHYLSVIPVVVSEALNVHVIPVFMVGTWLLVVLSCGLTLWLARRAFGSEPAYLVWVLPLVLAGQSLVFLWDGGNGVMMFGQREHIFALLFLPYVVARWSRAQAKDAPRPVAFALGAVAGLALSIKPQFAPIFLAFEGVLLLITPDRRRLLRAPEVGGLLVFSALYAGWWLLHLDSAAAYLSEVLPATRSGYNANGYVPPAELVLQAFDLLVLLAVAVVAAWATRFPQVGWLSLFAALTVGGLLTFAIQGKGWPYQSIPYLVFRSAFWGIALYFLTWLWAERRPGVSALWGRARALALPGVVALAAVLLVGQTAALSYRVYQSENIRDLLLNYSEPGDSIVILETTVGWTYPVLQQTERRQASRYLVPHPLAFAYYDVDVTGVYEPGYEDPPAATQYLDSLVEDIRAREPRLLLIPNRDCATCRVNPLQLLQARGILADVIAPQYERLGRVRHFEVFRRRA